MCVTDKPSKDKGLQRSNIKTTQIADSNYQRLHKIKLYKTAHS